MKGTEKTARDEAILGRRRGEGREAVRIERGRLVAAVRLVAVVRGLSRGDTGEPAAEGVGGRKSGRGAGAAGAHAAPGAEHGLLREVVEIRRENAAGEQRAADEGALLEERGGFDVDGGGRWLVTAAERAGEPAASSGAQAAARGRIERTELASTKAQLAICMAFFATGPKTEPSDVPERSEPGAPDLESVDPQRTSSAAEIRRNRELLDSYSEAVIVQRSDGTTGVYKPDEGPIDGDGVIVARKLPGGEIGWYAGPDAGPRSDPAAFRQLDLPKIAPPVIVREPDGTLTVNGKPGAPGLQRMFPGKPRPATQ